MPVLQVYLDTDQDLRSDYRLTRESMNTLMREELEDIGKSFGRLARHKAFEKAVGAVDGCHIRIKPPNHNKEDYFNYKQFYSIHMQAICDFSGQFLNIFIGFPGSVHDTRVLKNSPVYVHAQYPPAGYFLLGDGGYPCIQWPIAIITPYKLPLQNRVEERFNNCHGRARGVIERAFGMMKARWRTTMFKALEVKVGFCTDVVTACAFLHNICLSNGDVLEPDVENDDPPPPMPPGDAGQEASGNMLRARLSAQVSAPLVLQPHLAEHDYI
ncbi:hypothetical protein WMY93_033160 [Mugilogobius chulae]|uniref:DDE Tnp4 domain-containing protein n=1 Tax=Mugilogobius chulae TaxID=88201 RepID=A0AAW0MPP4_9GOBI